MIMNYREQYYRGVLLKLINRNYTGYKSKRFTLNNTNQNVWIPNKHLSENGSIKENENIDYVFRKASWHLELAGYSEIVRVFCGMPSTEDIS
jgi:hypothetical protein